MIVNKGVGSCLRTGGSIPPRLHHLGLNSYMKSFLDYIMEDVEKINMNPMDKVGGRKTFLKRDPVRKKAQGNLTPDATRPTEPPIRPNGKEYLLAVYNQAGNRTYPPVLRSENNLKTAKSITEEEFQELNNKPGAVIAKIMSTSATLRARVPGHNNKSGSNESMWFLATRQRAREGDQMDDKIFNLIEDNLTTI
jgi:hypothetical protein